MGNRKSAVCPKYTGLKDFARGVQKLYETYGNIPVFVSVDNIAVPFGMALTSGSSFINGQEAIVFGGYTSEETGHYTKGTVTD